MHQVSDILCPGQESPSNYLCSRDVVYILVCGSCFTDCVGEASDALPVSIWEFVRYNPFRYLKVFVYFGGILHEIHQFETVSVVYQKEQLESKLMNRIDLKIH